MKARECVSGCILRGGYEEKGTSARLVLRVLEDPEDEPDHEDQYPEGQEGDVHDQCHEQPYAHRREGEEPYRHECSQEQPSYYHHLPSISLA